MITTYSEAIEFYQSVESDLYTDLNIRMQNILTRSDVLNVLDTEVESKWLDKFSHYDQEDNKIMQNNEWGQSGWYVISVSQLSPNSPSKQRTYSSNIFEGIERRETQDSISIFEQYNDQNLIQIEEYGSSNFNRSTFWGSNSINLLSLPETNNQERLTSKNVAQFNIDEEESNDFVYHRGDDRNRHGVSFKVWRNKNDGAILRPKLMPNIENKREIHSKMLNENNSTLKSELIVYASKEMITKYEGDNGINYTIGTIEIFIKLISINSIKILKLRTHKTKYFNLM